MRLSEPEDGYRILARLIARRLAGVIVIKGNSKEISGESKKSAKDLGR